MPEVPGGRSAHRAAGSGRVLHARYHAGLWWVRHPVGTVDAMISTCPNRPESALSATSYEPRTPTTLTTMSSSVSAAKRLPSSSSRSRTTSTAVVPLMAERDLGTDPRTPVSSTALTSNERESGARHAALAITFATCLTRICPRDRWQPTSARSARIRSQAPVPAAPLQLREKRLHRFVDCVGSKQLVEVANPRCIHRFEVGAALAEGFGIADRSPGGDVDDRQCPCVGLA